MEMPLINILIRNKFRPELLERCLASIISQEYKQTDIYVASDSKEAREDIDRLSRELNMPYRGVYVTADGSNYRHYRPSHFWNLYCNTLKQLVMDGWFFFLDNDDYLQPGALHELSKHLADPAEGIICQFLRNGKKKPNDRLMERKQIIKGRIGGSCIVLHHSHKHLADWDGEAAADYRYIKAVSEKLPLKFIQMVMVVAGNNGLHGK